LTRILKHLRQNVIAYVALFVALGGAGYAATSLPAGSVGPAQLNRHLIGGYVRAWAHVSATGHVLSGSPGATVQFKGSAVTPPAYFVRWRAVRLPARCAPVATLGLAGSGSSGATSVFAVVNNHHGHAANQIGVEASNATGRLVAAEFYLAVVC
jgi:hypothetical protein